MAAKDDSKLFRVLPRQVDSTVAAALREWMPGKSWSDVKRLLKSRRVMLNGNLCTEADCRLRLQDVVKLMPHSAAPPVKDQNLRILYIDQHLLVVDKPSGVTTTRHADERHQRRRQFQQTLDEMLPSVIARKEKSRGRRPVRAVHRLDRETSGPMVFARTTAAQRDLQLQFREHSVRRKYMAVILGSIEERTIETRLVRDRGDGRRGSGDDQNTGKTAITHVRPLERLGDYSLVECRLETGRTHQIRIHLGEADHPVCGDNVYWRPKFKSRRPDSSGAPRLALAAVELGFKHPATGRWMDFKTPLPADLDKFVRRLRKES